ncbi:hypothetical protein [Streptomyces hygroscopicus]|uniref:hypothetical protein n=1 Tax=Streptomyces hygroscopicus TaxID=1912 RepID=UPI0011AEB86C|nr:hypothetical protein [Streptomyces sp. NBRC 109436]
MSAGIRGPLCSEVQTGAGPLHGRRRVAALKGEVAAGGCDVCGKRKVTRGAGQWQSAGEVALSEGVLPGVVGHPPSHLGQRRCRCEHLRAAAGVHEPGRHAVRQVPHHSPVETTAACLPVCTAEVLHGREIVAVRRWMVGVLVFRCRRRGLP